MDDGQVRVEHKVIIAKPSEQFYWVATCSCGWVGPQRPSYRWATEDEEEHRRGVDLERR